MSDIFGDNDSKVMDFMGAVQKERDAQKEDQAFQDSDVYKLRLLNKNREKMRDYCYDKVCKNIYRDAIPVGDTYKSSNIKDLDDAFDEFIKERCPQGLTYYIREGLKKGSPFAKKLVECVESIVKEAFDEREIDVEDYKADDMEFNPDKDAPDEKIEDIIQNLSAPEISQKLYDMTKKTAVDEISRAKHNKEELDRLQNELANDIRVTDRAAVESALEIHGYTDRKLFTPTIFEGMNIGNLNMATARYEAGELDEVDLADALNPILEAFKSEPAEGEEEVATESNDDVVYATPEEIAFVETVEEYTALNMIKALKLESFTKREMLNMADSYAARR